jgi:hypothetical protein
MSAALLSALGVFPISFLMYVLSERMNAVHQARVGRGITLSEFFTQTWRDSFFQLKQMPNWRYILLFAVQISIVFCLDSHVENIFYVYLVLNFLVMEILSPTQDESMERVNSERASMRALIGSVIAFLCSFVVFAHSGTSELGEVQWSLISFLFLPFFQIAGMIIFAEAPFYEVVLENTWTKSLRFYVWCMVSAHLFLGGSVFFLDLHVKAAALFVICRLMGQYFPKFTQRDLFRVSVLYLIPMVSLLWAVAMLFFGILNGDVHA